MSRNAEIIRETVVDERTSGTTGTATVPTTDGNALTSLGGLGLENFDELQVHIKSSQSLAGTTPTMDIYLQVAVVPDPNPATAAHWDDYARFSQVTAAADEVLRLPVAAVVTASGGVTDESHARSVEGSIPAAGSGYSNHWFDRIRIREVMGGTVTTACIYSIHIVGRIN